VIKEVVGVVVRTAARRGDGCDVSTTDDGWGRNGGEEAKKEEQER
jgi:hypothetical protein